MRPTLGQFESITNTSSGRPPARRDCTFLFHNNKEAIRQREPFQVFLFDRRYLFIHVGGVWLCAGGYFAGGATWKYTGIALVLSFFVASTRLISAQPPEAVR
jgi:hypothetical protein